MWLFCLSLLPYLVFTAYKSRKSIHMLQQNYYDESNRYFIWMFRNQKKIWFELDILFPILALLYFVSVEFQIVGFALFYILLFIKYKNKAKHGQNKKPLAVTPRVKRLATTIALIYLIAISSMIWLYSDKMVWANYMYLAFIAYLNYLIVYLANIINKPIEHCVYLSFRRRAIKRLEELSIPVIAITGSYGKTSSKNIISDILNVKYNAYATPKSYNTAYGLIRTINEHLDKFNDYFIAEMGAFKRGEIATTCRIARPKYGILTTIGVAHLDTFGSRENIQKGKFELIESVLPDGFGLLNGDDDYQLNYHVKNRCKIYWIGIENKDVDVYATNIKLSHQGTSFDVKFKEDAEFYSFNTRLLGKHNIYNILFGIILGRKLGMTVEELQKGVSRVQPIEHRLEVHKMGTLNIIDDAYNSNPVGSKMAVEILGMMPGRKIIVTPGMIELGADQYDANRKFGTYIADNVDYAILVGREQTKPIYDGLKEKNFHEDKIYILNDVKEAFPLMKRLEEGETYVLLENDLPDLFNE